MMQAVNKINEASSQIEKVINAISAASEESASAAEEMSGQSEMLTQLTSKFKLKKQSRK